LRFGPKIVREQEDKERRDDRGGRP